MNTGANCPEWGQEGVPLWEEEGDLLPPHLQCAGQEKAPMAAQASVIEESCAPAPWSCPVRLSLGLVVSLWCRKDNCGLHGGTQLHLSTG